MEFDIVVGCLIAKHSFLVYMQGPEKFLEVKIMLEVDALQHDFFPLDILKFDLIIKSN